MRNTGFRLTRELEHSQLVQGVLAAVENLLVDTAEDLCNCVSSHCCFEKAAKLTPAIAVERVSERVIRKK